MAEHGVHTIYSRDRDSRRYDGITVIDPFAQRPQFSVSHLDGRPRGLTSRHRRRQLGLTEDMGMGEQRARGSLVGNRLVLAGGILYLLEWVAIIAAGVAGVGDVVAADATSQDLLDSYLGNVDAVATMAAWFSLCLLGRVLVFVGLRAALADSGRPHALMGFAVVASAVSVTLEVMAYALATAAADLADAQDTTPVVILDRAGAWVNQVIAGGLGVAIVCSVWAMWRSGLFSRALNILGAVSGLVIVAAQLSVAPSMSTLSAILGFAVLLFWVWMLWAGGVVWRCTPTRLPVTREQMDVQP